MKGLKALDHEKKIISIWGLDGKLAKVEVAFPSWGLGMRCMSLP